jgi:hypothetical protein
MVGSKMSAAIYELFQTKKSPFKKKRLYVLLKN